LNEITSLVTKANLVHAKSSIIYDKKFDARKFKNLPERFLKKVENARKFKYSLRPWKYLESRQDCSNRYFITFIIKSSAKYVNRRFTVRRTWGSIAEINNKTFGLIFLVGKITDEDKQRKLFEENKLYGDILQSDADDSYNFLPDKVLSSFQYIADILGDSSEYFSTGDDDCYINFPSVYDYFASDTEEKRQVIHCGFTYSIDAKPIRDRNSKWHIPPNLYPGEFYPPFCHGGMVILTYHHIKELYSESLVTNRTNFILEDVMIFGILRQKLQNGTDFKSLPHNYPGSTTLNGFKDPLVFHLGPSKDLETTILSKWKSSLKQLNLEENNLEVINPLKSGIFFTKFKNFALLEGKTFQDTLQYFKPK